MPGRNRFNRKSMRRRGRHRFEGMSDPAREKIKFYRHLRSYIIVNAFMMFITLFSGGGFSWFPVILFWGMGLAFHYLKVFGWPGSDGIFSEDWERKMAEEDKEEAEEEMETLDDFDHHPVKEKEPKLWEEDDLV